MHQSSKIIQDEANFYILQKKKKSTYSRTE